MVTEFDLEQFLIHSRRVDVDDLPWGEARQHPLSRGEVRVLQYMARIEAHTITYLRELLSTRAAEQPEIKAFLSCWTYEEFFHGYYLERLLQLYSGEALPAVEETRRHAALRRLTGALKSLVLPALSALSPDFAAVHMAWGAVQECLTLHGYESLAQQSRHPLLRQLVARIVKDERRHFAFYYQQAKLRLQRSSWMRQQTRLLLDNAWRPVGLGVMPSTELDFIGWYLFRGEQGLKTAQRIDHMIAQLPGLQEWTGIEREVRASVSRQEARPPEEIASAYADHPPCPAAGGAAPAAQSGLAPMSPPTR